MSIKPQVRGDFGSENHVTHLMFCTYDRPLVSIYAHYTGFTLLRISITHLYFKYAEHPNHKHPTQIHFHSKSPQLLITLLLYYHHIIATLLDLQTDEDQHQLMIQHPRSPDASSSSFPVSPVTYQPPLGPPPHPQHPIGLCLPNKQPPSPSPLPPNPMQPCSFEPRRHCA